MNRNPSSSSLCRGRSSVCSVGVIVVTSRRSSRLNFRNVVCMMLRVLQRLSSECLLPVSRCVLELREMCSPVHRVRWCIRASDWLVRGDGPLKAPPMCRMKNFKQWFIQTASVNGCFWGFFFFIFSYLSGSLNNSWHLVPSLVLGGARKGYEGPFVFLLFPLD